MSKEIMNPALENPSTKIQKKFFSKKQLVVTMCILIVLGILGGAAYAFYPKKTTEESFILRLPQTNSVSQIVAEITENPTPTPELILSRNPFNGIRTPKEVLQALPNRPLAIMMDNSQPARLVQENLNRSDMVYEALVEGGWTRFMPIYYSDQSNFRVMPVRSVRMVFLDNLTEYNDPLLYHVGGAYTPDNKKTNAVQRIFDEKIKSIYFYKQTFNPTFNELYDDKCTSKGDIPGYSCKYRFTKTLYDKANEVGYQSEKWEPENTFQWMWKFDEKKYTSSDKPASSIKYKFTSNPGYDADWTFDAVSGKYLRKIAGRALIDHASNEQVWTNTIVVQKAKTKLNVDDKLRSEVQTVGSGDSAIFMDGKEYDTIWKKDCSTCRTRYYNKVGGEEFVFKPGKIWVSVTRDVENITFS